MTRSAVGRSLSGFGRHHAGRSAADGIVTAIEEQIAAQGLLPGHRIGTKQELCEQFGVAPATLSEALKLLRARGTIEVRPGPGGGAFVADVSPLIRLGHSVLALRDGGAPVNDVLGVIDALDEAVVREAAAHRTARDLRELDALTRKLSQAWHDPARGPRCNWALHRRIAQITPNVVLRAFYQNMIDYIEAEGPQASREVLVLAPDSERRLAIHHQIVAAIRSRDQDEVADVMRRHRGG